VTIQTTIHEAFNDLRDPRQLGKVEHPLINVIFITICAILCGADDWAEIEAFGKAQQEWLSEFLDLQNGIPSHDTLGRTFAMISPEGFSRCFRTWMQSVGQKQGTTRDDGEKKKQVCVDGKVMCGSRDRYKGREAIDIVSAFAVESGLTLAQRQTEAKSNEITAIPFLLEMLALEDCVVTIDAMGCQTNIAQQIKEQKGEYILSLKGNQGHLHEDTQALFAYFQKIGFADINHSYHHQVNSGHGRIEIRDCWVFSPHEHADYLRGLDKWAGLSSLVMVRSQRQIGEKIETEIRYFISSLAASAKEHLNFIRSHWGIENKLHYVLDVAFREDNHRARRGHSAANLAVIRHIVLNLLRQNGAADKGGIHCKRLRCGWDIKFRMKVLQPLLHPY
jgi:predicted transposase YbfD/YdcC